MGNKLAYIDGLTERERVVVDLLARGNTLRKIATMTGLCERSIYNYRKRPRVQRAVFALQQELLGQSAGAAISKTSDAVAVLELIMNDPDARASDRIAASKALMNGASQYTERKILERQLSDLEAQLTQTLNLRMPSASPEAAEAAEADRQAIEGLMPSASPEDGDE